ncbi:MAG: zinc protease [Crocinitomicaceae bacterium]
MNGLLLSGTITKSSSQIQEEINSLGGFIETGISVENSVISIYCLREYLSSIFNTALDAIQGVVFDPKEVSEYLADRTQSLRINKEKVGFLAQQKFREKLFSSNALYASTVTEQDIENVTLENLQAFHAQYYLKGLTKIVIVGDLEETVINQIIEATRLMSAENLADFDSNLVHTLGTLEQKKEGAVQSAIRAGRILFNKNHPDFLDFLILNTILGDYFGSRLMTNIREDKGYTYGIGSMVAELNGTGYFLIATEVGTDVKDATIKEIQIEIQRLHDELVPEDEIQLVKNYMLGQLLKSADGPYAMTDLFLSAEVHGKSLDFYNEALNSIQGITSARIQELAKKYLQWDEFAIVSVG